MLILDESATTDAKFGCDPYERNLESLLDAGVILVDKPRGPTSHQLTAWAREMLGIQRLGHGGTLDPFATGLLTMLCGKATRLTEMVLTGDKKYIAIVKLGHQINVTELEKLLNSLTGEIYNVPPLESAVKVRVRTRIIHEMNIIDSDLESNIFSILISSAGKAEFSSLNLIFSFKPSALNSSNFGISSISMAKLAAVRPISSTLAPTYRISRLNSWNK